jgi:hypothetical protein
MSRTMVWRTEGRINVAVHGKRSPTDLEWATYVNESREHVGRPDLCLVVLSRGGSPDGKQRAVLTDSIPKGARKPPVALLTDNAIARGAIAAMSIFNPLMKAFATNDLDGAALYLGLTRAERDRVAKVLVELERELQEGAPVGAPPSMPD